MCQLEKPVRVAYIITGLNVGGAEKMLLRLVAGLDRSQFEPHVISLESRGVMVSEFTKRGIEVWEAGMRSGFPDPLALMRLVRHLQRSQPDVVHTWMYHADLLGSLAARVAGGIPSIWCLRNSTFDRSAKKTTLAVVRACAMLSRRLPRSIVSCSVRAREVHEALGYNPHNFVVIPNGFDLDEFRPDPAARAALLNELGIPANAVLVGLVARFDPLKDHRNFIEAARRIRACHPSTHFILCGQGVDPSNQQLADWIRAAEMERHFHLLGRRSDMPRITAALDIATSASRSEAFPNTIGEAMACEVPCVATDAGDSAFIIGDTGVVVPPNKPELLAQAVCGVIEAGTEGQRSMGRRARLRILQNFNLPQIVRRYEALYTRVLSPSCAVPH